MGETTSIEWAHHTFNPWIGCTKVHAGCQNCFAQELAGRYGWAEWGPGKPRRVASESTWREPLKWARAAVQAGQRRRVFQSLGDPLDPEAPKEAQRRLWELIRDTAACVTVRNDDGREVLGRVIEPHRSVPGLDWLILTKRPERWEAIPADVRPLCWLGYSASNQPTLELGIGYVLAARGFAKRFLSLEPLIGPVDLDPMHCPVCRHGHWVVHGDGQQPACTTHDIEAGSPGWLESLDWVIVGGESGRQRRHMEIGCMETIAEQCKAAGVPVFVKQDAGPRPGMQGDIPDELWALKEVPR